MSDKSKQPQSGKAKKNVAQGQQQVEQLPLASFSGPIHLIDTPELLAAALPKIRAARILGLDTESRPSFKKGQHFHVALIQLATPHEAWLIRICKLGFTQEIIDILEDENIAKVGVSLKDDIHRLRQLHPFEPKNLIELQRIATECKLEEQSLRKLAARILELRISKRAQLTNWQAEELTESQRKYAATDAWICLKLLYHPFFGEYCQRHLPNLPPFHSL